MKRITKRTDRTSITVEIDVYERLANEFRANETWRDMFNRVLDELASYRIKERETFD